MDLAQKMHRAPFDACMNLPDSALCAGGAFGAAVVSDDAKPGNPGKDGFIVAAMSLDADLLRTFAGRRRRRIRDIASNHGADVRIDRIRGEVVISGPVEKVGLVRDAIRCLRSSLKEISQVLWAEFMRTRLMPTLSLAANLENLTGARVHIERAQKQVRIFGEEAHIAAAEEAIDRLECQCMWWAVPVRVVDVGGQEIVAIVAEQFGVTILAETRHLIVMGMRHAVPRCVLHLYKIFERELSQQNHLLASDGPSVAHSLPEPASDADGFYERQAKTVDPESCSARPVDFDAALAQGSDFGVLLRFSC